MPRYVSGSAGALKERAAPAIEKLAIWIAARTSWQSACILVIAGILAGFSLPPYELFLLLFLAFPVLIWSLDGLADAKASSRGLHWHGALQGWYFGFGYFLSSLYWMANAFYVDADVFGWVAPFAILGLSAFLALFPALATGLARRFWCRAYSRVVVLAICFTVVEWVRGHILTGFPWNTVGQSAAFSDAFMQLAALFGMYGMSFFVILVASALAAFDPRAQQERPAGAADTWKAPQAIFLALLVCLCAGMLRISQANDTPVEGVALRVVQPNIPQTEKWLPAKRTSILGTYLRMSFADIEPQADAPFTHLIWPESALPFNLDREPAVGQILARHMPQDAQIILGATRAEPFTEENGETAWRYFNSLRVLNDEGEFVATYDKSHLVPFGEYLPEFLRPILQAVGLTQIAGHGLFTKGPGNVSLKIAGAPAFSPLICYEIIFPGSVVDEGDRPEWIVTVTNDGWFGISAGPYQHFAQARFRAVEEGLPVIRAANTGVSGIINGQGQVLRTIKLGITGVIDAPLPPAQAPTVYALLGDLPLFILLMAIALFLIYGQRSERFS